MEEFVPCGAVAGVFARTDAQRGVWKAPAGLDARLVGVMSVQAHRRRERRAQPARDQLPAHLPGGRHGGLGARTLRGADELARNGSTSRSGARRCSSRKASTAARSGWCSSRTTSRCGRRSGSTSARSCTTCFARARSRARRRGTPIFVKCDKETTTQNDINLGIVNILVGFAPLKPAEFVIIKIQQMAGQIDGLRRRRAWHNSASTPQRFDPYKNFKFRVKWDGRYVAGVSKVGALSAPPRS